MNEQITAIKGAIVNFEITRARELLREAMAQGPTAEIYYLASMVALNEDQKVAFLNKAISLDPFYEAALKELAKLTPVQKPGQFGGPVKTLSSETPPVFSTTATQEKGEAKKAPSFDNQATERVEYIVQETIHSPEPVPGGEGGTNFIVATVHNLWQVKLYNIPHVKGVICGSIPVNSRLDVIARTPKGEWYNVIYTNSIGNPVVGWIPAAVITQIRYLDRDVHVLDLPISQFESNTRDDVANLIKYSKTSWLIPVRILVGLVIAICLIGGLAALSSYYTQAAGGIMLAVAVGLLVLFVSSFKIQTTPKVEIRRMHTIRRSKQTTTQNWGEDLTRIARKGAFVAATGVAAATGVVLYAKSMPKKTQSRLDINVNSRK